MRRRKKVNPERVLLAIVAEGFLSRLSFGVINVALPLYAHQELGMSLGEIGFLISLNTVVALLFKPVMGALADRFGLKRSLNVSVALRSAVTLLLAVATAPWQLFAARSVHGLSISMRDPVIGALIAEHGGKKRIAQTFAWYQTAKSVAGNAGKALAPMLLLAFGSSFSLVYLVAFALSLLPIFVVARYVRDPLPASGISAVGVAAAEQRERKAAQEGATVSKPAIASFMGLGFFVSATANMLSGLFPILVTEYAGLSNAVLSLTYVIGTAAAFTGPIFGWLSDHVGNKVVLSLRSAANIVSSVLYIVAPTFGGMCLGKALDDAGKAAFKPAWGAMMARVSDMDKKRRARMFGFMTAGEDAGEIAAPIVAGLMATAWGFPVMLGARIGLAVVTEIYTVAVTHRYLPAEPEGPKTLGFRLALPLRLAAGLVVGFGTGYIVGDAQDRAHAHDGRAPVVIQERAGAEAQDAGGPAGDRCSGDPTVDSIRRQTGGC
jgi:MFS family permease